MVDGPSAIAPCIVCAAGKVQVFLDLGETAYANAFPTAEDIAQGREEKFPLTVGHCPDCHHVQLTQHAPPSDLFSHYLYMSSASATLVGHLKGLAKTIVSRYGAQAAGLVLDVGCNDGTLLSGFAEVGAARVLGIDPAANLAPVARERGVEVVTDFFNAETARRLKIENGEASIITLTNSFPHIPDLSGLCRGFDHLLSDDGVIVLEAHYLGDLVDMLAFDTVYHEHVSYWSLGPARRLFAAHGFEVVDVERLPIHHGQLRLWVRRAGRETVSERTMALLEAEKTRGFGRLETFQAFAGAIDQIKSSVTDWLAQAKANGEMVVGYGAPAKGNTLLGYLQVGPDDLKYIADLNQLKQGRFTPGTHIPVLAPDQLLRDQPDFLLILAWNFVDEIVAQQKAYADGGGRFFVPVPALREVFGDGAARLARV